MKGIKTTAIVFVILIATGFVLQSFAKKGETGIVNGNTVGEFKTLTVEGCMDVVFTQGPATEARFEGDERLIDNIVFEKKGDELIVKFKDKKAECSSTKSVKIYLSSPAVENINLAGSGDITSTNEINNNVSFAIDLAGSGNIDIDLSASSLSADIAGSGNITVDGRTNKVDIDIAGSGDFMGNKFVVSEAEIDIAGSGNAYINTSGNISASIAGSGDVLYTGNPAKIKKDIAGSGKVKAAQ
ncbi:MAG: head GIN domain-containing protein [Chitinophagales bacterium]